MKLLPKKLNSIALSSVLLVCGGGIAATGFIASPAQTAHAAVSANTAQMTAQQISSKIKTLASNSIKKNTKNKTIKVSVPFATIQKNVSNIRTKNQMPKYASSTVSLTLSKTKGHISGGNFSQSLFLSSDGNWSVISCCSGSAGMKNTSKKDATYYVFIGASVQYGAKNSNKMSSNSLWLPVSVPAGYTLQF